MEILKTIKCSYCKKSIRKLKTYIERRKKTGQINFVCNNKCNVELQKVKTIKKNKQRNHKLCRYGLDDNIKNPIYKEFKTYMKRLLTSCYNRGHKHNIDLKYLKTIWDNQNGKCVLTGVQLQHKCENKHYQASLDRIDNTKGYIKNNIQFVSVATNWLKNKYGNNFVLEYFDIVKKIAV